MLAFVNVLLMLPVPLLELPLMPLVAVLVHAKVLPLKEAVGAYVSTVPLQVSCCNVLVIAGNAFTVATACMAVPAQPLAVGVIV